MVHESSADAVPRRALVFAGGDPPPHSVQPHLHHDAVVIGADSGVEHARRLGRAVDVAVGDFDSIDPTVLAETETEGATILRHPRDKDATDLELALEAAMTLGVDAVTVVGGHGGRVDHFVANCLLLASDRFHLLDVDAFLGTAHAVVARGPTRITGRPGELVTLLAIGGPAAGVRTSGLRFALDDATLQPGSTLGVSNEMHADEATVTVGRGTVLVIRPNAIDPDPDPASTGSA